MFANWSHFEFSRELKKNVILLTLQPTRNLLKWPIRAIKTYSNKIDFFLLITNHKPSSNASNVFPSSSHHRMHQTCFHQHLLLVLNNHHNHRQVPILIRSHPHFPGFSRENNQALLERGSINSGFRVIGEIRSEGIYLQMDPKMEDRLNQVWYW